MKELIIIYFLLFTLSSCGQNEIKETIVNANGKIISKTDIDNKTVEKSPEEILNVFYNNQNDVKELDKLMSFRFYQNTPYNKFKETMQAKYQYCGELAEKTITETEYSDDKKTITFFLKVKYQKVNTTEKIVMIKESDNDNFQILKYDIKPE